MIVILGILAGVAVYAIGNTTTNSAQAACKADFDTVQLAAEAFKSQVGAYPGGTYTSSYTVSKLGSLSNYTVPTATPTDLGDGVLFLTQTTDKDANSNSIGPWLHNAPVNKGHYEIVLSDPTGAGTIFDQVTVYGINSSGTLTGTIPATPSYTVADCSSVK